jgi:DnaJ family protein B protein 4
MTTHYEILGLSQDAGEIEIKKAYRTLSLKYHPDRNPSEEAKEMIQKVNEAYEILSDKSSRKQYDMELQFGGGGFPGGMPFTHMNSMNEMNDINNIFNMMFGGGMPGFGGPGGPEIRIFHGGNPGNFHAEFFHTMGGRPEPLHRHLQITIEQSYSGCSLPVEIERTVISNNTKRMESETVYINVPKGIDDNESVTLHERGNIINDRKGEVRITFRVINNTPFKRNGLDFIYNQKITLKDALCGFSFEINHLNGKKLCLNNSSNPTVIKPNFKKVVPNLGMHREENIGNLIIEFEILFPDLLTQEQVEALNNIL